MRRAPRHALPVLLLALLAAAACDTGQDHATPHGTPRTTSAPVRLQDRSLPCGGRVEQPVAVSGPRDRLYLAVEELGRGPGTLTAPYRITSADPHRMLGLPIGDIPPTALLLRHGVIVGRAEPDRRAGTVNGANSVGYPVGRRPYTGTSRIGGLCAGTTWADVARRPGDYQVAVVMSVQPDGPPPAGRPGVRPVPLVEATRGLAS
ncbi:hypothetical protein RKE29_17475 [Streptomyces sp. B1866]|uniref:hypothetical protein n=1 Tax=Streptomyces sp. B1866 TaxID=3075431 RepID=UPI002890D4DF|nr:hypothetical protein [Streptomyces sp. B1866]MDT3398417.1 hypothetical protein [Streptomyces sp. B1866]